MPSKPINPVDQPLLIKTAGVRTKCNQPSIHLFFLVTTNVMSSTLRIYEDSGVKDKASEDTDEVALG